MVKQGLTYTEKRMFSQTDFNAFAELSGDHNPIHVDAGFAARTAFGRPVAHGMMLYGMICGLLSRHFPGAVQLQQRLMFPAPTYAAEEMVISAQIIDIVEGVVTAATTIIDPDGRLTCEGEALLYMQTRDGIFSQKPPEPTDLPQDAISFNTLQLGQSASSRRVFNEADVSAYRALTGDAGLGFAAAVEMSDKFVPGPLLGGMISDLLGTDLPGRGTNWLKQRCSYVQPAYVGEEVEALVEIVRLRPEKALVNLRTTLTTSDSHLVCTGEALVLVKDLEILDEGEIA